MDEYSGVSRHKRGRLFKTPSYSTFGIRIGLPVADGPLTVLVRTAIEDENGAGAYSISVGPVGLLLANDIVALAEHWDIRPSKGSVKATVSVARDRNGIEERPGPTKHVARFGTTNRCSS